MEDDYYMSAHSEDEKDYYSSDREEESLDGLENKDSDVQWVSSKSPSSKVYTLQCSFTYVIKNACQIFFFFSNAFQ